MRTQTCHDCRFVKCRFQAQIGAYETSDFPFLQEVRLTSNTSNRLGCVNLQGNGTSSTDISARMMSLLSLWVV